MRVAREVPLVYFVGTGMTTPASMDALESAANTSRVYVGRQPIFDRRRQVVAYELLFRSGEDNRASFSDGNRATATVLGNTFMELGSEVVTGGLPAFVNITRDFVLEEFVHLFPPDQLVVEILEDALVDDLLLDRIQGLRDAGFRIALDDFVLSEENRALLKHADFVKLDVADLGLEGLKAHVEAVRVSGAKILAEKVETPEDVEKCLDLGFDLFQGYALSRPVVVKGRRPAENRFALLDLMAVAADPEIELEELERCVSKDLGLTYRLLRYINSAAFGLRVRVDSIRHALNLLGRRLIQTWINLVVISEALGEGSELLTTAMVRARMSKTVAECWKIDNPDACFTAGLLSVIDEVMAQPMEEILDRLPLAPDVDRALRSREGPIGDLLETVVLWDRGRWEEVLEKDIDIDLCSRAYLEAIHWAGTLIEHQDEGENDE